MLTAGAQKSNGCGLVLVLQDNPEGPVPADSIREGGRGGEVELLDIEGESSARTQNKIK